MCLQTTKIFLPTKSETRRGDRAYKFLKYQTFKLTFDKNFKPLTQFSNVKELLTAFTDAIQAHHEVFELARILHRDISVGSIVIEKNGGGILVDWDLSESTLGRNESTIAEHTGTWQFISYRLVAPRKVDEPMPIPTKEDDLESFWHVLFWVAMRHAEHGQPISEIKSIMKNVYDNRQYTEAGISCPETKYDKLLNPLTVRKQIFASRPLETILEEFQQIISSRYQLHERDKEAFLKWHQQVLEGSPKATESEVWDKLDSIIKQNKRFRYLQSRCALSLCLKDDWALQLCRNVCDTTTEAEWKIGGTNKYRPELLNSQQYSR
ncbi:hypothetical protein JR316_0000326 [Psilocybe cubensis]|uniref:Uncharacterized protein n=2 Tax=Psilocybe cubensis TaxID=181762 RepID=A0ACB8HF27_PSICU|nr:hypothetical protein JR316_0000326 [Psilocybe cubensis]KAH9486262.1 hypothetical protein JR316_0000326 [Psilocybe cubensis]